MKIIADDNIPFLQGRIKGAEVIYVDQHSFTPELVHDADAVVIRTRTRCGETLLGGSKVKLIATATIGTDQIDMEWCAANGITVRNAPGCNAPGVAQYVWSALLRSGFDPGRHTLGIVGCGNVGSVVKAWGEKLGVKMLINDPPRQEGGDAGPFTDLDTLLSQSDAVTLHTPLTAGGAHPTHHLIGQYELALMRDGSLLVNAARGPVVDFTSLAAEVKGGRLRTVIDTWEGEPEVDPELLGKALYGTFHIAGYSRQGKERATRMALEALHEELGAEVNTTGLSPAYAGPSELNPELIKASYDPATDTAALRLAPENFDTLRRNYKYREETEA